MQGGETDATGRPAPVVLLQLPTQRGVGFDLARQDRGGDLGEGDGNETEAAPGLPRVVDREASMRMKNRKQFAHRIDMWDEDGANLVDHLAGVEDLDVAAASYRAACRRWPNAKITLRQGARVVDKSW